MLSIKWAIAVVVLASCCISLTEALFPLTFAFLKGLIVGKLLASKKGQGGGYKKHPPKGYPPKGYPPKGYPPKGYPPKYPPKGYGRHRRDVEEEPMDITENIDMFEMLAEIDQSHCVMKLICELGGKTNLEADEQEILQFIDVNDEASAKVGYKVAKYIGVNNVENCSKWFKDCKMSAKDMMTIWREE